MIKVQWNRSLGSKLFLLVSACLTGTVGLISWQNGRLFGRYLDKQIAGHVTDEAQQSAATIGGILDGWRAQVALAVHTLAREKDAGRRTALANVLLTANRELVALSVFQESEELAHAVNLTTDDPRLEDISVESIKPLLKTLTKTWITQLSKAAANSNEASLVNWIEATKLPILGMAMRFNFHGGGPPLWAVLTVWQDRLAAALPQGDTVRSAVVDDMKAPLVRVASSKELKNAVAEQQQLLVQAKASTQKAGYYAFDDIQGVPRGGAFAKVGRLGLTTLVSRDARPGYKAMEQIVWQSVKWAWVIFLFSLLLSYISVAGVVKNLKQVTDAALRIANGDFTLRLKLKSPDEIGILSLVVNYMTDRIVELLNKAVAAARQEKELETAKAVQDLLYPTPDIVEVGLNIRGLCQVASECGGDWWWHYKTDDGWHLIVVADVTGHGAPAALVTAMTFACCTTIKKNYRTFEQHRGSISGFMHDLNSMLWSAGNGKTTMTAVMVLIEPNSGKMVYGGAGHTMPYYVPRLDESNVPEGKRSKLLRSRGLPLGLTKTADFNEDSLQLKQGDKILLYTDGLLECTNAEGRRWPKRQLESLLTQMSSSNIVPFVDAVSTKAFAHFSGHPVDDDVTIVGIEYSGAEVNMSAA